MNLWEGEGGESNLVSLFSCIIIVTTPASPLCGAILRKIKILRGMETLKKIGKFILCFLWLVNAIGGTITHFYYGAGFYGIANVIVSAMAFPLVKSWMNEIVSDGQN